MNRIKELRKRDGLTLKELAARIGVTESTAQRYESGHIKNMNYETVVALSNIFVESPGYIMGWEDAPQILADDITDLERDIIRAYRRSPESRREAVRALLGVVEDGKKLSASSAG